MPLPSSLTSRCTWPSPRVMRIMVNIGEAFLNHAKHGDLLIARQPVEVGRHVEVNADLASLCESLDIPADCGFQSSLVQQRRMEKMRDGADLFRYLIHQVCVFVEARPGGFAKLVLLLQ